MRFGEEIVEDPERIRSVVIELFMNLWMEWLSGEFFIFYFIFMINEIQLKNSRVPEN